MRIVSHDPFLSTPTVADVNGDLSPAHLGIREESPEDYPRVAQEPEPATWGSLDPQTQESLAARFVRARSDDIRDALIDRDAAALWSAFKRFVRESLDRMERRGQIAAGGQLP
jgi:hypothetical protein